jgi:hypothetical protein
VHDTWAKGSVPSVLVKSLPAGPWLHLDATVHSEFVSISWIRAVFFYHSSFDILYVLLSVSCTFIIIISSFQILIFYMCCVV